MQVSPYDCLGCGVCLTACPAKGALEMVPFETQREQPPNYDNYAIAADFNQEEKGLDILAHLDVVPAGEGWQETDPFTPLIKEGKIRYWGISETTEEYLRRAHAVCPVTAIQNRYSMMARWHETIFQACEELGVTYVAFSPLANGFLSGAYTDKTQFEPGADFRSNMPQYKGEGYQKGKALLDIIEALAAEKNVTTAQISLAWILSRKPYIIPIPGSRKTSRLKENLEAANVVLTKEESDSITEKLDGMEFDIFGGHK